MKTRFAFAALFLTLLVCGATAVARQESGRKVGPNNRLTIRSGAAVHDYRPGPDVDTSGFSASGSASGRLAFVGYGIRAVRANHDDYAGIEVKGKIVLLLDGYPGDNPRSPLAAYADIRRKATIARGLGAIAIIEVVTKDDFKRGVRRELQEKTDAGMPILRVRSTIAELWINEANHKGLPEIWEQADAGKRVSMLLNATATLTTDLRSYRVQNVPGRKKQASFGRAVANSFRLWTAVKLCAGDFCVRRTLAF